MHFTKICSKYIYIKNKNLIINRMINLMKIFTLQSGLTLDLNALIQTRK